jgi:6-phosphogluconolactonase (cycloisomerase 2 family)
LIRLKPLFFLRLEVNIFTGTCAVNSIPPSPGAGKSGIFGFTINGTAGQITPIAGYGLFDPQIPFGGPTGMTIDGSGKYLYFSDNYLREFTIGAGGVLQEGPIIGITSAVNWNVQAADPTGKYVYAWYNYVNGNIALSVFAINASTGALTEITGSPFLVATGSSSWPFGSNDLQFLGGSITFSPSGKFLYASVVNYPITQNSTLVTNNYIYTVSIHPVTGALSTVPGSPVFLPNVDADQLVMHPSGKFLYASPQTGVANNPGILMFPIDATSGVIPATPVSAGAGNSYYRQILVDPSGNVLVGRGTTMDSFTINSSTGLLTAAGSLTADSGPIPPTPTPAPLNFGSSVIAKIP